MQFTHYDLGNKERGDIVEISLTGSAANVRLMDSSSFQNYRNGRQHKFYGGLVKQSPFRLAVPNSGHWHLTVDMQGLIGSVRTSIRMLPKALATARQAPLSSVPSLIREQEDDFLGRDYSQVQKKYDVFISHATEDKIALVRPLVMALQSEGLSVWYDEFELKIGDSLRKKIDKGVANSKFGIVVLSKDFIRKGWTNYELDGIVTNSINGKQIILPIWHNLTKQEVIEFSPSLADKVARNTASSTVDEIAFEISELIHSH